MRPTPWRPRGDLGLDDPGPVASGPDGRELVTVGRLPERGGGRCVRNPGLPPSPSAARRAGDTPGATTVPQTMGKPFHHGRTRVEPGRAGARHPRLRRRRCSWPTRMGTPPPRCLHEGLTSSGCRQPGRQVGGRSPARNARGFDMGDGRDACPLELGITVRRVQPGRAVFASASRVETHVYRGRHLGASARVHPRPSRQREHGPLAFQPVEGCWPSPPPASTSACMTGNGAEPPAH